MLNSGAVPLMNPTSAAARSTIRPLVSDPYCWRLRRPAARDRRRRSAHRAPAVRRI